MSPPTLSFLRRARDLVRLEPFETVTEGGRARERYRRAALGSLTSLIARALGMVTGLVSVPLTLTYLGRDRYGLWNAISALLTWAALMDFGLGRGLVNHLSDAHGRNDTEAAARVVSTGLMALLVIAVLSALAFAPALALVPWTRVLNVTDPALQGETRGAVAAVAAVFLASFPLSVVGGVYAAYQRSYVANLFSAGGSLASLAALVLVTRLHGGLTWLILSVGGVGVAMNLVTLGYIARDMPWLRPRFAHVHRGTLRSLAGVSLPMLLFQLGSLLINELQIFAVAHRMGLGGVADYNIYLKVFTAPLLLVVLVDGPLAPAFREAVARGDLAWVRDAFWRSWWIKLALCGLATVFYVVFGNPATALLSGQGVSYPREVWWLSGLLIVVGCWNGSFNTLLIAFNRLWLLVGAILLNGVVTATLTWWLSRTHGIAGVVAATAAYSLVVTGWLFPVVCWKWVGPARRA